ncbi:LuxR C-terminal-related transcriptional regulator [Variovorax saccharolyticus]|uniref:LuxR C-terminal-related transcriptional regulator n=1 Tax=Variovorax saccharolyticus TaxID=3053516 RepID=UPI0025754F09|nr:LuxR C-terminal-related transcriptional regulator [Variovorax sp. J22R187]MDM0018745.1 LuxR C-terminal-related transcriptional regulator [Variovorax sp. J22R187]
MAQQQRQQARRSGAAEASAAVLVEAKLAPPQLSLSLLARSQLSSLLHAGLSRRLISVTAPAGYGKTTALAQWVAQVEPLGIGSAWLSLDTEDNDPLRFMRYLAAALHHADARLGRNALAQADGGNLASIDALMASLLHDLTGHDRRLLLVLDDFHLVHHEAVHRKLEWLVAHLPPTVGLVIASRTRLPLSVSQLRLRGELLELDAANFGLNLDEAADFVGRVSGAPLDRAQVETLHGLTEGWIAGLQLASLALRESGDRSAFLADFSGTDRDITDYLGEQVLDSLRPELRAFLLRTAGLDRFCTELCDEVLRRDDSRAMLAEVQSRNLFLSGLDRSRTWFRYHHLFADYLRGRARELPGDTVRAIHLRASDWFHRHRLPHEAVRHAFEAQDLERAADLVASFSGELVQHRGEHATLLGWLTRLPQALVHARPKIRTGHAWSLVLTRRYPEADQELRALEAACAESGDDALRRIVEMIRCVYWAHTGELLLAKARSEAWLQTWPEADAFLTGVVANVLASGCCATEAFEQGLRALAIARRALEECRADYGLAWACALAMMIAMRRGDQHEAMAQARAGIATVERSLGVASYAGSMITLLAAEVCYEQNDLVQAQRFVDQGLPFIDEHGLVEMTTAGYLTRARLLRLRGDPAAADACLLEGESLGHRLKLPRLVRILAAERCTLRLQSGAAEDALKLAQSYGFVGHGAGSPPAAELIEEDSVCLLSLRLRLSAHNAGAAVLGALNDALRRAQRDGHQGQLARLLVQKALHQHRALDRAQALRTLDEALALAARCGLLRSLLDGDALLLDMAQAIHASRGESQQTGYLQQLLQAAGRSPQPAPRAAAERGDAEELTERELKILRLLKAGLGNRELAQSLFLSEATVKWHLHNIFAKLGVKNRTSALARAQEISLL